MRKVWVQLSAAKNVNSGSSLASKYFLASTIFYLYTNKRESFLTSLPNFSQESAPIGTYDTPFDSYCHRDGPRGVRFPEFFAVLGKNPGNDWVVL